MSRIRLYVAQSLDGFIADAAGGVDWLAPFDGKRYGCDAFIDAIGAVVLGRRTFEQMLPLGGWHYPGKPGVIMASREIVGGRLASPSRPAASARPCAWYAG